MSVESSISLAAINQGQKLEGTVKKVTLSGAIVDVGAPVDGLLHISDLGDKRVTRTSDVLRRPDDHHLGKEGRPFWRAAQPHAGGTPPIHLE